MYFVYDADENLFSMNLNGGNYYYLHNAQNDIVGLLDSHGVQVVSYKYDSWGNFLEITDSSTGGVGSKNPFRYKEYYWDEETRLYYLSSRYYDPMIYRFISMDSANILEMQKGLYDKNLYTYCDNNPISRIDAKGDMWEVALVGGGSIAASSGVSLSALGASIMAGLGAIAPIGLDAIGAFAVIGAVSIGIRYAKSKSKSKKKSKSKSKKKIKEKTKAKPRSPYTIGKRKRYNTRKRAKQAVERATRKSGKGIRNGLHRGTKNNTPHFHVDDYHDHYYYLRRFY